MREKDRRGFERHGLSILGRSIVAGLLAFGFVAIAAGNAASIHWEQPGPAWWSKTTQTITFTSTRPSPAVVGGTYTPTANGGASGNPVTFSIDSSAHGSCSISGATVTLVAVGTCVIDANQAGNASYEAATQVQQSFAVLGTQSITFTSNPPSPAVVGGTYPVKAGGGASGNPVTFSIDSSAHGSCSISGATVTLVAVGTCVIDANQAGNASYEAATRVQQSFAVLGTQSITFTSTPPSPAVVGGTYPVKAGGGASGNPVTFSIDSSAHGSCSISGATVTLVAVGTCVIDANQAGNASYEAATQVQQSFTISASGSSPPPSGGQVCTTVGNGSAANLPPGKAWPSNPAFSESDGYNTYTYNNVFDTTDDHQDLCATGPTNLTLSATDTDESGSVDAYPDIAQQESNSTTTLAQLTALSSTFASTTPPITDGNWEEAYDIWLSNGQEVMIWVNTTQDVRTGSGATVCNSNVSIDGQSYTYQVWPGPGVTCADSYQTSPASEVGPNSVDMVLNTNETSGTINIKDVLAWLEANDSDVPSTATIGEIDFGWEFRGLSGTETFAVSNYSLTQSPT